MNYYPFGLKHKGYNNVTSSNGNSVAQKFKYNGIEFEEGLGLNLYEMNMRQYDPAIARWLVHDPVTHHRYSPYQSFDNNPIYYADPMGADSYHYDWDAHERGETGVYVNNTTREATTDYQTAISDTTDELGIDSRPLTKKELGSLLGTSNNREIEDRFEALFQQWGRKNYRSFKVPTIPYDSEKYVGALPDGVSTGMTLFGRTGVAPNIAFWDSKASSKRVWGVNFIKDEQLKAYIEILSSLNVEGTTKNVLIYVTTSDVVNVNAVREYAEGNGVGFRHIVAYSEWGVLGRYLVFKERVWTGVPEGGGKPYNDVNLVGSQDAVKID